jgi:hypothetical protein
MKIIYATILLLGTFAYAGATTVNIPVDNVCSSLGSTGMMTSGYGSSISDAHDITTGDGQSCGDSHPYIRTLHNGSGYYLARVWIGFDISALNGYVIDSVNLLAKKDSYGYVDNSGSSVYVISTNERVWQL